jgi:predicted carbohydrate-binding protein with CBM5 and CBM33 domain
MWIVMTSSAKMPSSCWGRYLNVALVQLNQHYAAHGLIPAMISENARGVLRIRHLGHHNSGSTDRCAAARVIARAEQMAQDLNNAPTVEAGDSILMSWGGSA